MDKLLEGLKRLFRASAGATADAAHDTDALFDAMDEQQKEFHKRKQKVEEDINRGARYTRTKLPL